MGRRNKTSNSTGRVRQVLTPPTLRQKKTFFCGHRNFAIFFLIIFRYAYQISIDWSKMYDFEREKKPIKFRAGGRPPPPLLRICLQLLGFLHLPL